MIEVQKLYRILLPDGLDGAINKLAKTLLLRQDKPLCAVLHISVL